MNDILESFAEDAECVDCCWHDGVLVAVGSDGETLAVLVCFVVFSSIGAFRRITFFEMIEANLFAVFSPRGSEGSCKVDHSGVHRISFVNDGKVSSIKGEVRATR